MRVLRTLTSEKLPCGCLVGVYELYSGHTTAIIDVPMCAREDHKVGQQVELPSTAELAAKRVEYTE
jgi:hypothetical protein